jgi:1-pyrroline-5-carboxylate dehydrogenase
MNGTIKAPPPRNEPVWSYAPGTPERDDLKARLKQIASERIDIPLIIGGEEVRTGDTFDVVMPHDHGHVLATAHRAGPDEVARAVAAAREARH